jgi:hypothetical protein
MPAIIYEKTPGGLFATGERTISTFRSGLVRVEQTFICPTSAAATHRAALAVGSDMPGGSAPAIDGLKIFPEPQEKKRTDGFTEFVVSAYGRVNTTEKTIVYNNERIFQSSTWLLITKMCNFLYVIKGSEALYRVPTINPSTTWDELDDSSSPQPAWVVYNRWGLESKQISDFGIFKEVNITFKSI